MSYSIEMKKDEKLPALLDPSKKNQFLALIATGKSEKQALLELDITYGEYLLFLASDSTFDEEINQARKRRGDVWFHTIIEELDSCYDVDEVSLYKLKFDKLKYLAAMDNPEKYSEKVKDNKVEINFGEYKQLSNKEMKEIIEQDPFAIDAEFEEVETKEEEDGDLL